MPTVAGTARADGVANAATSLSVSRVRWTPTAFLAVVQAYDVANATLTTLYYGTTGFTTSPTDTPASTYFEPRIKQPASMRRDMFASGTTMGASRVGIGDLVLLNGDGALDGLLGYAFDGRSITIYQYHGTGAFPAACDILLTGTMEQAEFSRSEVKLRIRDRQLELETALQSTLYAGSNVLPAGLEGVEDLKGKPKPIAYGVVRNIAPPCVNTSKLIYQVNDGAVASVDGVYDNGIRLGLSNFEDVNTSGIYPYAIAASPTTFVAVGDNYRIFYSLDGETWVDSSPGISGNSFWTVSYGGGKFIAAGAAGNLYSSPDGINWTSRTSQFGADIIWEVAYGADGWMAVGAAGKISVSTDGETWTARSSLGGAVINSGVVYGNGLWVLTEETGKVYTSVDYGVNWVSRHATTGDAFKAVAWSGNIFVAVGNSGRVETSVDGIIWDSRVTPLTASLVFVRFVSGFFITGGDTTFATSLDGIRWARQDNPFGAFATMDGTAAQNVVLLAGGTSQKIKGGLGSPAVTYASATEIEDDTEAPTAGNFGVYLAGGYIRLGSPPAGQITADVTQGAAASDRTAAQIWTDVLVEAGMTSADWNAVDVTALDAIEDATVGFWSGVEPVTCADVASGVAGSVGAWWGVDRLGKFRIAQFGDPVSATPAFYFTANDMVRPLERIPTADEGRGIPIWRSVVKYSKNWTVQAGDLAGGVSDARRADLGQPYREVTASDAGVKTAYLLSREQVDETLLAYAADATTEATRRLALRDSRRDRYEFAVQLDAHTVDVDLGSFVNVTHPRFGLTGGKTFTVITVEPDAATQTLTLGIWG